MYGYTCHRRIVFAYMRIYPHYSPLVGVKTVIGRHAEKLYINGTPELGGTAYVDIRLLFFTVYCI